MNNEIVKKYTNNFFSKPLQAKENRPVGTDFSFSRRAELLAKNKIGAYNLSYPLSSNHPKQKE